MDNNNQIFYMRRHQHNQIEWLEFELLADFPRVKHAIFLRHGGFSQGPFASLNAGLHVGDCTEHVQSNLQAIEEQLKKHVPGWKRLVFGRGAHGKAIAAVHDPSRYSPYSPFPLVDFDGLMTSTPGLSLMMTHADCQAALFYDPLLHVAANIHAGWRGSVTNIYAEAVKRMQETFGSHPANLLVCISPSLGPDEAEFIHYRSELPEEFWSFQVRPTYFDFWAISEYQLQAAGILPHHIEVARLSTYANAHDFFSYRRDKVTGRHAACMTLI